MGIARNTSRPITRGWKRQAGEYRVVAELCRLNLVATPFAGNVLHYDIIATVENGQQVDIQVKTIRDGACRLDVGNCAKITMRGRRQDIGRKKPFEEKMARLILQQREQQAEAAKLDAAIAANLKELGF